MPDHCRHAELVHLVTDDLFCFGIGLLARRASNQRRAGYLLNQLVRALFAACSMNARP